MTTPDPDNRTMVVIANTHLMRPETEVYLTAGPVDVTTDDITEIPDDVTLPEIGANIRVPLLAVSYIFTAFHVLLAGVIVFGNSLVLASFVKYHSVRTIHNLFLLSMSVSDLLTAPTLIVIDIVTLFYAESHASRVPCVVAAGMLTLTILGSVWNLLLVTLERYVTVVYPFRYMYVFTGRTVRVALVTTWTGLVLCPIITLSRNKWYPGVRCYPLRLVIPHRLNILALVFLLVVPIILVTVCYVHLSIVARKHRRQIRDMLPAPPAGQNPVHGASPASPGGAAARAPRGRSAKQLGAILGLMYISWIPTIVNPYYVRLAGRSEALAFTVAVCQELSIICMYAGPCLNPFIYHKTSKEYRQAFKKLLRINVVASDTY